MTDIKDKDGLVYVWFEILELPDDDNRTLKYAGGTDRVFAASPDSMEFALPRIPNKGEWIKNDGILWQVEQVIFENLTPRYIEAMLKANGKIFAATVQVRFCGVA